MEEWKKDDDADAVLGAVVGTHDVLRRGAAPGTPCAPCRRRPPLPPRKSSGRPTPMREADDDEEADDAAEPREETESFGRLP